MSSSKPHILLMGQTPPPWHGQAVATQILFDHDWSDFEVHRLRMEFSEEMVEVGRFQWKKIKHLFHLIVEAQKILKEYPDCLLFYPPASAKWIPFLRDIIFLISVRPLAGATVFIYHASGLPVFTNSGWIRRSLAKFAYDNAEVALEVAQEKIPPHQVYSSKSWSWCPCAIEVPLRQPTVRPSGRSTVALFVGSLQDGKGVLEILKTARILRDRGRAADFKFRVVGKWFSEEFEADVRHLRSELQLEEMVELAGQLTGDAKWDAYHDADVFFFPTHYASEATPIVLMEALGAGLPVISTEWAGIPAMMEGCQTATLLPILSPDLYADALESLDTAKTAVAQTFINSRAFYEERFLPARFIGRVADAFHLADRLSNKCQEIEKSFPEHSSSVISESLKDTHQTISPLDSSAGPTIAASHLADKSSQGDNRDDEVVSISEVHTPIRISVYLADQNPGYDRSFGISRMSQVVLEALVLTGQVFIEVITSQTSQQAPPSIRSARTLPWGTRSKGIRLLTDHFHPLFSQQKMVPDIYYYPKGYLPLLNGLSRPSIVTIHDTIIQYDEDHYPKWRSRFEYIYWAKMLKHTLKKADCILTVSNSSKCQIEAFMTRHGLPQKEIRITDEPCAYETLPQPVKQQKANYVLHLASVEPHKQTANLVKWWSEAEKKGRHLPVLHLIGSVPTQVAHLLSDSASIVKRPFLEDEELQTVYQNARALVLPSEIEGFGLPALEAYYLGTPVCFVKGTSVEEILKVTTSKGAFLLEDFDSLFVALDEVMAMSEREIHDCGLKLRDTYAAEKVAERMMTAFRQTASEGARF